MKKSYIARGLDKNGIIQYGTYCNGTTLALLLHNLLKPAIYNKRVLKWRFKDSDNDIFYDGDYIIKNLEHEYSDYELFMPDGYSVIKVDYSKILCEIKSGTLSYPICDGIDKTTNKNKLIYNGDIVSPIGSSTNLIGIVQQNKIFIQKKWINIEDSNWYILGNIWENEGEFKYDLPDINNDIPSHS